MKIKISISAEVDFTEMLLPENVEGAKLALGANNEVELIKKFSENILANTQSYASNFRNMGNVVGDISLIESDEPPQAEHQAQETDDNEAQQEVDFRETMRKIREYQEQQQRQDTGDEGLSDDYLGNYVDTPSLSQEETIEHYEGEELIKYYEGEELIKYYEGEEIDLADTEEESTTQRLDGILHNIKAEGYTVDSIVVESFDLKDHILENDEVVINKDSIIVREDLETDFVIRYIDETNKIFEVVL